MSRSSAICVDASLVVRLLLGPENQDIKSVWDQWDQENRELVAPGLIYYEVLNALYQYERHGKLSADTVTQAFEAALSLPIRLHFATALQLRALDLTRKLSLSACYDAQYLALAEQLDIELWTGDARLVNQVRAQFPRVHLAVPRDH